MVRKISEIYAEYKIMPNLQEHMLRVAAVASLICDNFNEPLPKEDIITACLLHDMGNIIKSNLEYFPKFLEPEGLEYWQNVKREHANKYGFDEHKATAIIAGSIGLSNDIIKIIDNFGFSNATKNELGKLFSHKICNYSDERVGPYGVMPMEGRILEGQKRYAGTKHSIASGNFESLTKSLRNIEKQIFSRCKIKPEDITDETIQPLLSELREFVVK